jgi:tetratricopeptide (TPR) repeat protein
MPHDVFISYSSKDKSAADSICAGLETKGVVVWLAPRDIVPGMNWSGSIIRAINDCRVFVLLFTAHSNISPQVNREVERAINKHKPVVLFRLEDIAPVADLEYFISASHWLDAIAGPLEPHVESLAAKLTMLMQQMDVESPKSSPAASAPQNGQRGGISSDDAEVAHRFTALAEGYLAEGDTAQAAEALAKALDLNPDDVDAHFLLGTTLLYEGHDIRGAVREYGEVTRLDPNHFLGYLAGAMVLRELCDFDAALEKAAAALAADPANLEARELVGALENEIGVVRGKTSRNIAGTQSPTAAAEETR